MEVLLRSEQCSVWGGREETAHVIDYLVRAGENGLGGPYSFSLRPLWEKEQGTFLDSLLLFALSPGIAWRATHWTVSASDIILKSLFYSP